MTTDSHRFRDGFFAVFQLFTAPIVLIASLIVLIIYVGPIVLAGFGFMFIIAPLTIYYGKRMALSTRGKVSLCVFFHGDVLSILTHYPVNR